jgi:hypothetical protein
MWNNNMPIHTTYTSNTHNIKTCTNTQHAIEHIIDTYVFIDVLVCCTSQEMFRITTKGVCEAWRGGTYGVNGCLRES